MTIFAYLFIRTFLPTNLSLKASLRDPTAKTKPFLPSSLFCNHCLYLSKVEAWSQSSHELSASYWHDGFKPLRYGAFFLLLCFHFFSSTSSSSSFLIFFHAFFLFLLLFLRKLLIFHLPLLVLRLFSFVMYFFPFTRSLEHLSLNFLGVPNKDR